MSICIVNRIIKNALVVSALVFPSASTIAQAKSGDAKMDAFVNGLMSKMTVDEKIGQLNLVVGGQSITGSTFNKDIEAKIAKGNIGGIFGVWGTNYIKKAQEIAIKESRLHIPLIFGLDVIHGHRTIFPIPLGMSATWDMKLIEQSARTAAREATAE